MNHRFSLCSKLRKFFSHTHTHTPFRSSWISIISLSMFSHIIYSILNLIFLFLHLCFLCFPHHQLTRFSLLHINKISHHSLLPSSFWSLVASLPTRSIKSRARSQTSKIGDFNVELHLSFSLETRSGVPSLVCLSSSFQFSSLFNDMMTMLPLSLHNVTS